MTNEEILEKLKEYGLPISVDEIEHPCGYFTDQTASDIYSFVDWIWQEFGEDVSISKMFTLYLECGFRRSGNYFYINKCKDCHECTPIRIPVEKFKPSKSQRAVFRKNQDVEIKICYDSAEFVTEQKIQLYKKYDYYHNHGNGQPDMTYDEAKENLTEMHNGMDQIVDMEYWLGERLIGVGIVDFAIGFDEKPCAISSNYFYYDVSEEILKRSIGVFSVLKEIELCLGINAKYYYLGLFLPNCRKMNYKTNYKPYELLIDKEWKLIEN